MVFFFNCTWQYLLNFSFSFGYMGVGAFFGFSCNCVLLFWGFWVGFLFLILITIFSVRKLTTEKDYFICISSPVFAIQNVTLRSMLQDDIYPAPKIAGQLYSGPAAVPVRGRVWIAQAKKLSLTCQIPVCSVWVTDDRDWEVVCVAASCVH